jgi:2-oxoglutarate ferredoxin oxidoreductase subunit gamma
MHITHPEVLEMMSQETYTRFTAELKHRGTLIIEQNLFRLDGITSGTRVFGVPATHAVAKLLDPEALRKAVADSVPPALQKLNLQAFDRGFKYGTLAMSRIAEGCSGELDSDPGNRISVASSSGRLFDRRPHHDK